MNDVALGHGDWLDVLRPMQGLLDVTLATVEILDKCTGEMRFLATDPVDEVEARIYEEHVHQVNPRFSLLPISGVGQVRSDRDIADDVDVCAGDYYEWLQRAAGTRYFAGAILFDTPDYLGLSSINQVEAKGQVSPAKIEAYQHLVGPLANALAVHQALAARGGAVPQLDDGALGSDRAYALLDSAGAVLECSAEFERVIARSDSLRLHARRLGAVRGGDNDRLMALIRSVTAHSPAPGALLPLRVLGPGSRHGVLLRAITLNRSRELFARMRPAAIIVLVDLDAPAATTAAELRAVFGLTKREAELALLIGHGRRLEQAAAELSITELTARTHLKAIYRRIDIDRQTELVRLMSRIGG